MKDNGELARLFCARRPSNARRFGVWMPAGYRRWNGTSAAARRLNRSAAERRKPWS